MPWLPLLLLVLPGCGRGRPAPSEEVPQDASSQTGPVRVESEGLEADLAATQAFFASRPPYERPFATGLEQVEGLGDLSADTCRACHMEIHGEWQTSVHAQAWVDPQYQAEIGKSGNRWLCLNCHTPLLTQQDLWPRDLVDGDVERPVLAPNPVFDAELREQGITCAACHVRGDAIAGPGLGGNPPHKVVVDESLRSGELCNRCHTVEATYANKTFICTFQTGKEFEAGPWDEEGETCVSCHMPPVERVAGLGGPERTVARHWWRGAGIPKLADGPYPPPEANAFGLELAARVDDGALVVEATNAHAGHRLPTGDPERWVQVDVRFLGSDGRELGAEQFRYGQTWEWTAPPRKVADNRLKPRETRRHVLSPPAGAVSAEVVGSNHRISKENAEYHHLGDYPRSVEVRRLTVSLDGSTGSEGR